MVMNPELRRYLWLDFSWHRLVLTPITIGTITYLFYLLWDIEASASIASVLGSFFIFLWGSKNASEAVLEEVNNHTWDFQRQSLLSPWSMTWGKLLGSTAFSWYAAFIALAIYILISADNKIDVIYEVILTGLGGLFGQALALLLSLQILPFHYKKNHKTFRYFIIGALSGWIVTKLCLNTITTPTSFTTWFAINFYANTFAFFSLLLFLGWALVGLQRSFGKELQYRYHPWVWGVFNLFCMIYFSGFTDIQMDEIPGLDKIQFQLTKLPFYTAFFIAQLLIYFALLTEEITLVRYKKLLTQLSRKHLKQSLQQFPWWGLSFTLSFIAGVFVIFQQQDNLAIEDFSPVIFILSIFLFTARDILLFHYFQFKAMGQRALGTFIVYLSLLYLIIPLIFTALHLPFLPAFLPSWGQNTPLALISLLSQIGGLSVLCWQRWRATWQNS